MHRVAALLVLLATLVDLSPGQAPRLRCSLAAPAKARLHDGDVERALPFSSLAVPRREIDEASFPGADSRIDIGPHAGLGIGSNESFTVRIHIRTDHAGFCTPLMCREGGAVNYSFVMGREPGTISFEIWTWAVERAISTQRIDDGRWHEIAGVFDASTNNMGLLVDGEVQAVQAVSAAYRPSANPTLRLGNNIGAHQPFRGSLRSVGIDRGVPAAMAKAIAISRQFTILGRGKADAMFEAWLVRMRAPKPPVADDRRAWTIKAAATRARLQNALGLLPPPYPPKDFEPGLRATDFAAYHPTLPLATKRGGTLERDGYTVTRMYWQTVRGYFSSGYLYEPKGDPSEPRPAVLCPHGHFQDGARHPVIQSRCITLAKDGYFVLAVDSVHITDEPIGLSPLSLMTWNNLRGLELLRSLPGVDAKRIGCTGASGGGQQTFYLTGLRTGLAAVVPAVMVCYFEEILLSSGVHCRCNFTPGVMGFADEPLLSACFAPNPQLFLSVTGDWTKNFPKRGFPEVRAIYEHFGAAKHTQSLQWESGHDYNRDMRNAMYAFFARHLKGQTSPPAELEPAGLRTENRNALLALDRRDVPRDLDAVKREWRQRLSVPGGQELDESAARARLHARFGGDLGAADAKPQGASIAWEGRAAEPYLVQSTAGIRIPMVLLRPANPARRATLIVSPAGKSTILHRHAAVIRDLLGSGHAVAIADVRYCGELDSARSWREPYGKIFGRDVGVVGAVDIAHVLKAVGRQLDLRASQIALVAFGELGVPALYAAALHGGCGTLVVPSLGRTYARSDRRPMITGILQYGDLPVAVALLPKSTKLLAGGCPEPADFAVTETREVRVAPLAASAVRDALR